MRVLFNKSTTLFINKGIFAFFMTQYLPSFSKQFSGQIWRMEIDEQNSLIYLEIRNAAAKVVSFAAVDLASGETKFDNLTLPERWLTGIEAAYNGVLLLHGYQSQNAPVHKGLTAIGRDGSVIWSDYSLTLDHLSINGPVTYAAQIQPRRLYLTDVETRQNVRPFNSTLDTQYTNNIDFPETIEAAALNLELPLPSYNNVVDYLAANDYRIVSLHTFEEGQLKQHLFVWKDGVLVYEDLLNHNIQKMQPESFILCKNRIVYIKNKTELGIVLL